MCTLNVTNKVMVCFVVIQERCWIILIWRRPNDQTYRRGRRLADQCTVFERWILVGKPLEIRHCNVGPTSRQRRPDEQNDDGPTLAFDVKPTSETTVNRRWTNVTLQTGPFTTISVFNDILSVAWSIFATCIYTIFYSLHVSLFSVM